MEILHMLPFILRLHFKEKVCIIFQYGTTVCNSERLLSATVFVLKAPFFSASSNEGADEQKVKQRKPHKFNLFSRSVKACTLKPLSDKEGEPYFLFTSILFLRFFSSLKPFLPPAYYMVFLYQNIVRLKQCGFPTKF